MTTSCTAALEMAALLADFGPGDEVIIPSYTFTSTANPILMAGAKPVFVDISPKDLCITAERAEEAITSKTRAVINVHYAGLPGDSVNLKKLCKKYKILFIEDAAQSFLSRENGQPIGSNADMACYSFHETKSLTCGEGGALLINDTSLRRKAEIFLEKGTDRLAFSRGETPFYRWRDKGSSFGLCDTNAAFLLGQIEKYETITEKRRRIWQKYSQGLHDFLHDKNCEFIKIPRNCELNYHMFWIALPTSNKRNSFAEAMRNSGVAVASHYVPLHNSPCAQKYKISNGHLPSTEEFAGRLIRLPLFNDMSDPQIERVISECKRNI